MVLNEIQLCNLKLITFSSINHNLYYFAICYHFMCKTVNTCTYLHITDDELYVVVYIPLLKITLKTKKRVALTNVCMYICTCLLCMYNSPI